MRYSVERLERNDVRGFVAHVPNLKTARAERVAGMLKSRERDLACFAQIHHARRDIWRLRAPR